MFSSVYQPGTILHRLYSGQIKILDEEKYPIYSAAEQTSPLPSPLHDDWESIFPAESPKRTNTMRMNPIFQDHTCVNGAAGYKPQLPLQRGPQQLQQCQCTPGTERRLVVLNKNLVCEQCQQVIQRNHVKLYSPQMEPIALSLADSDHESAPIFNLNKVHPLFGENTASPEMDETQVCTPIETATTSTTTEVEEEPSEVTTPSVSDGRRVHFIAAHDDAAAETPSHTEEREKKPMVSLCPAVASDSSDDEAFEQRCLLKNIGFSQRVKYTLKRGLSKRTKMRKRVAKRITLAKSAAASSDMISDVVAEKCDKIHAMAATSPDSDPWVV